MRTLMTGILFGEQPRWHEGRLWFSDWGTQGGPRIGLGARNGLPTNSWSSSATESLLGPSDGIYGRDHRARDREHKHGAPSYGTTHERCSPVISSR